MRLITLESPLDQSQPNDCQRPFHGAVRQYRTTVTTASGIESKSGVWNEPNVRLHNEMLCSKITVFEIVREQSYWWKEPNAK